MCYAGLHRISCIYMCVLYMPLQQRCTYAALSTIAITGKENITYLS